MKATELRQSILQAAVQGRLVSQNASDESATELLRRIQQEKTRLVKEGKIKKEKPLPPITEDEIPYELPNGWVWCRLGDIVLQNIGGGTPSKQNSEYWGGNIPWASVKDLNREILCDTKNKITSLGLGNSTSNLIPAGNVIICTRMGLGKIVVNTIDVAINQDLRALFFVNDCIVQRYFICFYRAQEIVGSGMTVKGITIDELHLLLFPLPPLVEQQRIVAKIDELMALCEKLEVAEKELDTLENNFTEFLPKSILEAAVQGKLVPQNQHDESALELLKHIQRKKAKLVKEGKIKKEKSLPPVTENEIPYDLPRGWVWCRLGDVILRNIGGGTPSKQNPEYWGGNIPWASVKDLNCEILYDTKDKITSLGLDNSTSNLIPAGNVIICTRMGLGKIAVNAIDVAINQDLRALFLVNNCIVQRYFIHFFRAQEIIGSGMTVKGITIDELHLLLFPLPPLAEQKRIVSRVDELMALCDELKTARSFPSKKAVSKVVLYPSQGDDELLIAARGDASKGLSVKAQNDVDKLFGNNANE